MGLCVYVGCVGVCVREREREGGSVCVFGGCRYLYA